MLVGRQQQVREPTKCDFGSTTLNSRSSLRRLPRRASVALTAAPALVLLDKQRDQLLRHRAAQLFGVDDGDGFAVIARDVVADADGREFDRRALFDVLDDVAQVPFEIIAGIDGERGIIDRRAVRDYHQDLALFGSGDEAVMRPHQRFAVDIFLEQAFAHHQAEIAPRAPPGFVGRLVDYVSEIVPKTRIPTAPTFERKGG